MQFDFQSDPQDKLPPRESSTGTWRVLGAAGVAVTLGVALFQSFPLDARQPRQFLFAGLIVVATLIVLRLVFPSAWMAFRSMPDLLVPIGLVVFASTMVDLLATLPAVGALFVPSWSMSLLGLSLRLSFSTVLHMIIWTGFAAWQTDLLWRAAQGHGPPELAPWLPIRRYFFRAFVALTIGVGALLLGIVPAVAVGSAALVLGAAAMLVLGVVWNLLTVALLPYTMFYPGPVFPAVGEGFKRSWMLMRRWWIPLVAQLVLLGIVVMVRAHFTASTPANDQGSVVTNIRHETRTNVKWQVNAFWVGGYEIHCRWFSQYAAALETKQIPLIRETLAVLFLVVAAAMKWTVIRVLHGRHQGSPDAKPVPGGL